MIAILTVASLFCLVLSTMFARLAYQHKRSEQETQCDDLRWLLVHPSADTVDLEPGQAELIREELEQIVTLFDYTGDSVTLRGRRA